VIFITHNVHHAYPVGDAFTILNRGRTYGTFRKEEVSREEVLNMMAGGKELEELSAELEEFSRADAATAGAAEHTIAEGLHREAESLHKH
jgi:simple sugar transport system ATP-binding protein